MKIETAIAEDIPSIVRVANELQLDPAQAAASFLVSNFGSEKYRELCNLREDGRFFVAKDPAGALVGFIISYRNEYAASNADISLERNIVDGAHRIPLEVEPAGSCRGAQGRRQRHASSPGVSRARGLTWSGSACRWR